MKKEQYMIVIGDKHVYFMNRFLFLFNRILLSQGKVFKVYKNTKSLWKVKHCSTIVNVLQGEHSYTTEIWDKYDVSDMQLLKPK